MIKKILLLVISFSLLNVPSVEANYQGPCSVKKLNKVKGDLVCVKVDKFYRWVKIEKPITSSVNDQDQKNNIDPIKTVPTKQDIDISGISIKYFISENAKLRDYNKYTASLNDAIIDWYPVFNKGTVNIVLFTENDSEWIDKTQTELMGNWLKLPSIELQSYRLKQYGCNIGGFYLPNIIVLCVKDNDVYDPHAYMVISHEYAHLVGMTSFQISNFPLGSPGRLRPCWIEEGIGTFYGLKSASLTNSNFINDSANFINRIQITADLKSTTSIINTMYDLEQNMKTCNKVQDAYFLGSAAFSILYNEYGHDKILEFNKMFFSGVNWKSAFYNTFKLNVDDFYDKLAKKVVKP